MTVEQPDIQISREDQQMGFSVSWLAIPVTAKDSALATLGFVETNEREWLPESSLVGASLPTGWYVVCFEHPSPAALKPESLRLLSRQAIEVACQVEEHAMVSTSACWSDGKEQWFVVHDAEDGPTNLEVVGNPPAALEEIRLAKLRLQESQRNVDHVFDVPLALAESLVGFRHDAAFDDSEEGMFAVLARGRGV
ncbi:hypothetical protein [Herbaspirillum robiniae]|uniref:Uncharacterized protein n=1 Tax=Herbaspirillum robiniae TaxID=2014887 RepID=A0ABX2M089_9BURK|nr:hypothetical protein [Herbaspirillum robiniae]NUU01696.1 hypothetical protein [Herbaspirillum robiniae]